VRVEFRSYPRTYILNIYEQHTFAIACNEDKQTNKTVTVEGIPTEKQPNIQQTNKRCNLLYYELYFTGLHLTMSVVCGCPAGQAVAAQRPMDYNIFAYGTPVWSFYWPKNCFIPSRVEAQ